MVSTTPTELEQAIRDAATNPASASNDAGSVTGRNVDEIIKADRYLSTKAAAEQPLTRIRIGRIVPPGAC